MIRRTPADLDAPDVDIATDQAHWASSGARHAATEDIRIWETSTEFSNAPADPLAYPIVQVLEFEMKSGGEEAVAHGMEKFNFASI